MVISLINRKLNLPLSHVHLLLFLGFHFWSSESHNCVGSRKYVCETGRIKHPEKNTSLFCWSFCASIVYSAACLKHCTTIICSHCIYFISWHSEDLSKFDSLRILQPRHSCPSDEQKAHRCQTSKRGVFYFALSSCIEINHMTLSKTRKNRNRNSSQSSLSTERLTHQHVSLCDPHPHCFQFEHCFSPSKKQTRMYKATSGVTPPSGVNLGAATWNPPF